MASCSSLRLKNVYLTRYCWGMLPLKAEKFIPSTHSRNVVATKTVDKGHINPVTPCKIHLLLSPHDAAIFNV